MDLSNMSSAELRDLQEKVKRELKQRESQDLAKAREQIMAIAQSVGVPLKDLVAGSGPGTRAKTGSVAPKRSSRPTTSAASSIKRSTRAWRARSARPSAGRAGQGRTQGRDRPRRPPVRPVAGGGAGRGPAGGRRRRDRPRHGRHPDGVFRHQCAGRASGIMVTGSHNPPDYNGFKMVLAGEAIYGDAIPVCTTASSAATAARPPRRAATAPTTSAPYLQRIIGDVKISRPIKIAVDCGNGVAGAFAGDLYRGMGCEVIELFCEVDGTSRTTTRIRRTRKTCRT
jgi:hypothetical protein